MSPTPEDQTAIVLALARLEGKLDVVVAQHNAKLDEHARRIEDQEDRLREVERRPDLAPQIGVLAERVQTVEQRPAMSRKAALAWLGTAATVTGVALTFADRLINP